MMCVLSCIVVISVYYSVCVCVCVCVCVLHAHSVLSDEPVRGEGQLFSVKEL